MEVIEPEPWMCVATGICSMAGMSALSNQHNESSEEGST